MHAPVEWKLYDICGVHHVTAKDKEIFMLVEKDYPLRKGLAIRMISYKLQLEHQIKGRIVGNKMHKAIPLPVIEFPLPEEVPTASEESCHCQKKREATAVKIALLLKSRRNYQSKSDDSFYLIQEKHLDNIKKYQSLKRKPIYIAQARKNMIVYLKNMAGYKIQHFKGMTYDQVRPIFKREYNHVQTFKSDRDKKPSKKRVAKETLLQESFKKLRVEVEVLGSSFTQQDTPTVNPAKISKKEVQNMLQIVPVAEFKVEALQVKYPRIDWEIHFEGSRSYWKIIRVGGITEAYKSLGDMLKSFDKEDLDAL
nr:hypothetical protein [Tanacetum cinerariifolium]